jgi:uncharacterized damage-inducible protein DinB
MDVQDAVNLYDFNAWADRRTLDACSVLDDAQFVQDLGNSFPSIRDTLVHVMLVEWVWLERWNNRAPDKYPPAAEFPNLTSVHTRWTEIERNLLAYVASLKSDDLQKVVHHKTMAGVPQAQPLWQMLQHLVNHGSYHRGQVATMLRQSKAKPSSTDLITFYRERAAVQPHA